MYFLGLILSVSLSVVCLSVCSYCTAGVLCRCGLRFVCVAQWAFKYRAIFTLLIFLIFLDQTFHDLFVSGKLQTQRKVNVCINVFRLYCSDFIYSKNRKSFLYFHKGFVQRNDLGLCNNATGTVCVCDGLLAFVIDAMWPKPTVDLCKESMTVEQF